MRKSCSFVITTSLSQTVVEEPGRFSVPVKIDQQSPFWFLGWVNKVGFSQIAVRETFSMEVLRDAREVLFYCVQCMDA